jgi:hypothetical protein
MNAFYEHHKGSIKFAYRCFDRLLLNGLIQPFQQPERVLGFFNTYRDGRRVTRQTLAEIAGVRSSMPESASLAGSADATARQHLSAMQKRLLAMLQPRTVATAGRLSDRPRFIALRAEVAGRLYSLLLLPGAATGWLLAPALLLSGRALRQPDLLPPCRRRAVRRALAGHEPNHRTTPKDHSHLWPETHSCDRTTEAHVIEFAANRS